MLASRPSRRSSPASVAATAPPCPEQALRVGRARTQPPARRACRRRRAAAQADPLADAGRSVPQYVGTFLLIHYGSPLATRKNTIVVPVKTGATGGFRVEGRQGSDGTLLWTHPSDYVLPPHNWAPSFSPAIAQEQALDPGRRRYPRVADAHRRDHNAASTASRSTATTTTPRIRSAYDSTVFINTPLTVDKRGNVFFGFMVTGNNPSGLESGIARISNRGVGSWVTAAAASGDPAMTKVAHGSAPAVTRDGKTVYVAVSDADGWGCGVGYLVALDAKTLATRAHRPAPRPEGRRERRLPERQRQRLPDHRPRRRRLLRRAREPFPAITPAAGCCTSTPTRSARRARRIRLGRHRVDRAAPSWCPPTSARPTIS